MIPPIGPIGLEYIAFFLHIISRAAFRFLQEDTASELIDAQVMIFKDHMMATVKNATEDNQEDPHKDYSQ